MQIIYQNQLSFDLVRGQYLEYPAHMHSHCEIQFVRRGSLEAYIDGKNYTVNENELLFVMPYQVHSYESKFFNESDTVFISSSHLGNFADKFPENPVVKLDDEKKSLMCQTMVDYILEKYCEDGTPGICISRLRREERDNPIAIQLAKACLNIAMDCANWISKKTVANDTTRHVLEYCIKNYNKDLSLEKMAEHIGVSTHTVTRVFSNVCKCSFRQYINRIRVSEAAERLADAEDSIAVIAEKCGFSTQRTFNRVFLAEKGLTPGDYRKKYKKQIQAK